jgi:YggT family protein
MIEIYQIARLLLDVVFFVMVAHIIMSWLLNFGVLNQNQPTVNGIWVGLNKLLEPIYGRLRRILPDTSPLDLAPLAAFLIVIVLRDILLPAILLG